MSLFKTAALIKGRIEGPIRVNVEKMGRSYHTVVNFEIRGDTFEMIGDELPPLGDHEPVPPPFVVGDTAIISAHSIGDSVFMIDAMSVPCRSFFSGNDGSTARFAFIVFFVTFLIILRGMLREGFTRATFDSTFYGILAANVISGYMALASYNSKRTVRMVREAAG